MAPDLSTSRPVSRTLSRDLAGQLRDRIVQAGLQRGDRFFSHQETSSFAGVSKVTARMATKVLEREGILESRAGQGTFVIRAPGRNEPAAVTSKRIGIVLSQWDRQDRLAWDYREIMSGMVQEVTGHFGWRLVSVGRR